jgi:hypothetical protein
MERRIQPLRIWMRSCTEGCVLNTDRRSSGVGFSVAIFFKTDIITLDPATPAASRPASVSSWRFVQHGKGRRTAEGATTIPTAYARMPRVAPPQQRSVSTPARALSYCTRHLYPNKTRWDNARKLKGPAGANVRVRRNQDSSTGSTMANQGRAR